MLMALLEILGLTAILVLLVLAVLLGLLARPEPWGQREQREPQGQLAQPEVWEPRVLQVRRVRLGPWVPRV